MPLLNDPLEGCCFCEPEAWRTIYSGRLVTIIAGAGPLCSGYTIVSPRQHHHTIAELSTATLWELLVAYDILVSALEDQYGPGYSAYEHGRTGACLTLEAKGDLSTFCHHAHRVVLPVRTDVARLVSGRFKHATQLRAADSITALSGRPYVFYETGAPSGVDTRVAFTDDDGLPSQFMRRLLTDRLGSKRAWNWASDYNYEEMMETVSLLRGGFLGLDAVEAGGSSPLHEKLSRFITVDGLAAVGKTTLARLIGAWFRCSVIETGYFFRHLAEREHSHQQTTDDDLVEVLLRSERKVSLRRPEITKRAAELAATAGIRKRYERVLQKTIGAAREPCVVVGRDVWRLRPEGAVSLLVVAGPETRARRRSLQLAQDGLEFIELSEMRRRLTGADEQDQSLLPSPSMEGVVRISNDGRRVAAVVKQVLEALR